MGKSIAIITARGGSKRIPHKNIKDFCGRPIISYPIEAALASECFDEVMVSTDDEQIAKISREYGAKIPFLRGEKNSGDFAGTVDVIEEVLGVYEKRGEKFETACCIYPTAPFVTKEKLQQAMKLLSEADSVMPVVRYPCSPLWALSLKENTIEPMWPEYLNYRSQDLQEMYYDCGQFYCFWVRKFQESRNLIMGKTLPIKLKEWEVQDIDNPSDWKIAELKFQYMNHRSN